MTIPAILEPVVAVIAPICAGNAAEVEQPNTTDMLAATSPSLPPGSIAASSSRWSWYPSPSSKTQTFCGPVPLAQSANARTVAHPAARPGPTTQLSIVCPDSRFGKAGEV